MKKIIIFVLLLLPINTFAITKNKVEFFKCVDGDTARFILNKQEIKVRFIGIDTPESVKPNEEAESYGKEAANYTCRKLKNASRIYLEYEPKAEKEDKYGRRLAYVYIDDKLLQEQIVKNGYANVKYINKDYKYYDQLMKAEEAAKNKKKGIYSNKTEQKDEEDFKEILTKYFKKYAKKLFSNILKEIFK